MQLKNQVRIVMFLHSLLSDWNHGNAHFLRGVATELLARGHQLRIFEPRTGWSLNNLLAGYGSRPIADFHAAYPGLESQCYDVDTLDLDEALEGADLVMVHEWNDTALVQRIGEHRSRSRNYRLLFHDTHHRSVTAPEQMAAYDLRHYDGVLAFGQVIRDIYLERGWAQRAWTWHEAADVHIFHPAWPLDKLLPSGAAAGGREFPARQSWARSLHRREGDLVWIGNWGDEERTAELHEFLIGPVQALGLKGRAYGVRYPVAGKIALAQAGIEYAGWLPNFRVPAVFARYGVTVHIPRRPYTRALPGIPTIRPFEALACGIPLVSAPWDDVEHLFTPGEDFLVAHNGDEMQHHLRTLLADKEMAREVASHGLRTILRHHTCAHRVNQLLEIVASLETPPSHILEESSIRAGLKNISVEKMRHDFSLFPSVREFQPKEGTKI